MALRHARLRASALALAVVAASATLFAGSTTSAQAGPPVTNKVYVCKYSASGGTERLQTFTEVATGAIKDFPSDPSTVVFPYRFGDAQERSIAIGFVGDPVRTIADCPAPGGPVDLPDVSVPATPQPVAPDCDTDGSLTVPVTANLLTSVNGALITSPQTYGPGSYTISYAPAEGFELVGTQPGPVTVLPATGDCPVELVPVDVPQTPVPTAPDCDTDGSLTVPLTDNLLTSVDGVELAEETVFGPGTYEITYAAAQGFELVGTQPGPVTVLPATGDCPVELVPVDVPQTPVPTAPDCDTDGSLTVPLTDDLLTSVDGVELAEETVFGPGTYEITYAAAEGFELVGTQPGPVTVLPATGDCPIVVDPVDPEDPKDEDPEVDAPKDDEPKDDGDTEILTPAPGAPQGAPKGSPTAPAPAAPAAPGAQVPTVVDAGFGDVAPVRSGTRTDWAPVGLAAGLVMLALGAALRRRNDQA